MAERNPPSYLRLGNYNAADDRLALSALLGNENALAPDGGIVPTDQGSPLLVAQSGGGLAVTVAAGQAVVPSNQLGAYLVTNDAAQVLALAAANATQPRVDLVVARVYDADAGAGSNAWALEVVTGTPAASPATPATPANAIALGTVRVPAGSTGGGLTFTDLRKRATGIGKTGKHTPRGVVALLVTSAVSVGNAEALVGEVPFTFEAGRLYRCTWTVHTVDGEGGGGWDTSGTSQASARMTLRYAVNATPTPASAQTHFGGVVRVAVFSEDPLKCAGGCVVGYLHDLTDGATVHVGGFLISEFAAHLVKAGVGVLEIMDVGAWPTIWPQ